MFARGRRSPEAVFAPLWVSVRVARAHSETLTQRHTRHSDRDTDTERDTKPEAYRQNTHTDRRQ